MRHFSYLKGQCHEIFNTYIFVLYFAEIVVYAKKTFAVSLTGTANIKFKKSYHKKIFFKLP